MVDGCFWHACPVHGTSPQSNADWWRVKITRNVERDQETDEALRATGWEVVRVWEHEAAEEAAARIQRVVTARRPRPVRQQASVSPPT